MKKTILIVISKDIIRRNIIDTDFWPVLKKANPDARFVLAVCAGQEEQYRVGFEQKNIVVVGYAKEPHRGWRRILFFLVRTGIHSRSNIFHRWHAYKRGRVGFFSTIGKSLLSNTLARFSWYKDMIRWLLLHTRGSRAIERILDEYHPNLVFTPSLIDNDVDALIALEAKRRGIRVVGMVRSWDNLNHHGLLAVVPDRFVFQNQWLKEAAGAFQAIDVEKMRTDVIGLPHYDLYKNPAPYLRGRGQFLQGLGLESDKKLIFLAGTEYSYLEMLLPRRLEEMINSGAIRTPVQVLFRPHPSPKVDSAEYGMESMRHVKIDRAYMERGKRLSTDTGGFIQLMWYADVVINICSTLSIDAAVFDTPAIALEFDDPERPQRYWKSMPRFNEYFDHQRRLIETGGVRTPRSLEDLARDIDAYLDNPSLDAEGRKKVLEEFVAPFDGKAGERLASILTGELAELPLRVQ